MPSKKTKRTAEEQAAITAKRMATIAAKKKAAKDATMLTDGEMSLDAIPDREPRKKYQRRAPAPAGDDRVKLALAVVALVHDLLKEGLK